MSPHPRGGGPRLVPTRSAAAVVRNNARADFPRGQRDGCAEAPARSEAPSRRWQELLPEPAPGAGTGAVSHALLSSLRRAGRGGGRPLRGISKAPVILLTRSPAGCDAGRELRRAGEAAKSGGGGFGAQRRRAVGQPSPSGRGGNPWSRRAPRCASRLASPFRARPLALPASHPPKCGDACPGSAAARFGCPGSAVSAAPPSCCPARRRGVSALLG